jgi:DNA-binding NtrC family response regulator
MNLDTAVAIDRDAHPSPDGAFAPERETPEPSDLFTTVGLVGTSRPMQRLRADVLRYARSQATVLVNGETGSGKELVARALHTGSARSRAPLVCVNAATLRAEVLASELFGHERGAFTGALTRHRGLFEQAHGGTLFLDEVGELDLRTQADLLRVLESGEVRALGCERPRTVNLRVLVATHRDLAAMVTQGLFRADLYYRLNVLSVVVPPLRQRREDLAALVHHMLERLQPEVGPRTVSPDAVALLRRHEWPGNVRELLNVLRRMAARTDARMLEPADVRAALGPLAVAPPRKALVGATRAATPEDAEALAATNGNISAAARRLGIARSTLRERLDASRRGDACPTRASLPRVAGHLVPRATDP